MERTRHSENEGNRKGGMMKLNLNELDPEAVDVLENASIAALESLDNKHIDTILDACQFLFGGRYVDGEFAVTYETLDEFDVSHIEHWNERGKRSVCTIGDNKFAVYYENMQPKKGDCRRSLLVINLSDVCLAITKW